MSAKSFLEDSRSWMLTSRCERMPAAQESHGNFDGLDGFFSFSMISHACKTISKVEDVEISGNLKVGALGSASCASKNRVPVPKKYWLRRAYRNQNQELSLPFAA